MATARRPRASLAPYREYPVQRLLHQSASRHPHKVAIIDGNRTFTYRQLDEYSDRFAGSLIALGVNKGDFVGIFAPNCAEFAIAFYGISEGRRGSYHGKLRLPGARASNSDKR